MFWGWKAVVVASILLVADREGSTERNPEVRVLRERVVLILSMSIDPRSGIERVRRERGEREERESGEEGNGGKEK